MNVLIIANGTIVEYKSESLRRRLEKADYIICCDGGLKHCVGFGIYPDIVIGDFDSAATKDIEFYKAAGIQFVTYPVDKDKTDMELAVDYILDELKPQSAELEVTVLGAVGGRLDHTLGNVFLLKCLVDNGIYNAHIADEYCVITLVSPVKPYVCNTEADTAHAPTLSLIPISAEVTGVTTQGLYYALDDATMLLGSTWGLSNKIIGNNVTVTISGGYLLVVLYSAGM